MGTGYAIHEEAAQAPVAQPKGPAGRAVAEARQHARAGDVVGPGHPLVAVDPAGDDGPAAVLSEAHEPRLLGVHAGEHGVAGGQRRGLAGPDAREGQGRQVVELEGRAGEGDAAHEGEAVRQVEREDVAVETGQAAAVGARGGGPPGGLLARGVVLAREGVLGLVAGAEDDGVDVVDAAAVVEEHCAGSVDSLESTDELDAPGEDLVEDGVGYDGRGAVGQRRGGEVEGDGAGERQLLRGRRDRDPVHALEVRGREDAAHHGVGGGSREARFRGAQDERLAEVETVVEGLAVDDARELRRIVIRNGCSSARGRQVEEKPGIRRRGGLGGDTHDKGIVAARYVDVLGVPGECRGRVNGRVGEADDEDRLAAERGRSVSAWRRRSERCQQVLHS